MTQQSFAEYIEMSPASLSSIFNGRTKPTLNIVEAIKRKFPDINVEWLMFGTGNMFTAKNSQEAENGGEQVGENAGKNSANLSFDFSSESESGTSVHGSAASVRGNGNPERGYSNSVKTTHPEYTREETKYFDKPQRKITEIRVYFDDLTFETFVPAK